MKTILIGLCALSIFAGLASKTLAQPVRITLGPAMNDSYWIWSDQYQCWIWSGPEFPGDYQGHSFFKEHFLNHQFFNFFENTPAIFSDPPPSSLPAEGVVLIQSFPGLRSYLPKFVRAAGLQARLRAPIR